MYPIGLWQSLNLPLIVETKTTDSDVNRGNRPGEPARHLLPLLFFGLSTINTREHDFYSRPVAEDVRRRRRGFFDEVNFLPAQGTKRFHPLHGALSDRLHGGEPG